MVYLKNLLSSIKNAIMVKKTSVSFKYLNKNCLNILLKLYENGFIQGFYVCKNTKKTTIFLRYYNNNCLINGFYFYKKSKIGRPLKLKALYRFKKSLNCLFLLTKNGVLTGRDCLGEKQGGYPLFFIY